MKTQFQNAISIVNSNFQTNPGIDEVVSINNMFIITSFRASYSTSSLLLFPNISISYSIQFISVYIHMNSIYIYISLYISISLSLSSLSLSLSIHICIYIYNMGSRNIYPTLRPVARPRARPARRPCNSPSSGCSRPCSKPQRRSAFRNAFRNGGFFVKNGEIMVLQWNFYCGHSGPQDSDPRQS
jgi:hypothetical protein